MTGKAHFTEEEKDKIIEQLLVEKPWRGLKHGLFLFLRKYFFVISSILIGIAMLTYVSDYGIVIILPSLLIPIFSIIWNKKFSLTALDLKMTDRDWVTMVVKGNDIQHPGFKKVLYNNRYYLISNLIAIIIAYFAYLKHEYALVYHLFILIYFVNQCYIIKSISLNRLDFLKGLGNNKFYTNYLPSYTYTKGIIGLVTCIMDIVFVQFLYFFMLPLFLALVLFKDQMPTSGFDTLLGINLMNYICFLSCFYEYQMYRTKSLNLYIENNLTKGCNYAN